MFQQQVLAGNPFGDILQAKIRQMENMTSQYSVRFADGVALKANVGAKNTNSGR